MNFGQLWRTDGILPVKYIVTLPSTLFDDFVNAGLPEIVDDMRMHPDPNDEYERLLRKFDWPSDAEAIRSDDYLLQSTLEWFAHDMMLRWFGDGEPDGKPGFVFNTVESTTFNDGNPVISGSGRHAGIDVVCQDV